MINDTLNKSSDLKLIFQFIRWKIVNFTCLKNFARIPSWMSSSASFFILNISAHISRFQKQNLDWVKVWYKYKITHRGKDLRDDGIYLFPYINGSLLLLKFYFLPNHEINHVKTILKAIYLFYYLDCQIIRVIGCLYSLISCGLPCGLWSMLTFSISKSSSLGENSSDMWAIYSEENKTETEYGNTNMNTLRNFNGLWYN